jgi:hypothetical protein
MAPGTSCLATIMLSLWDKHILRASRGALEDPKHAHFSQAAKDQESGVRSQESGVRSQESGVRSQESGVRSQESGVRSQESGVRFALIENCKLLLPSCLRSF